MLSALLTALPGQAAEKLTFFYGPFVQSVQVSSLNVFAQNGSINSDLEFYFKLAKADTKTQQEFRQALTARLNLDPVLLSRLFYSELGEGILTNIGRYIQIPQQGNGMNALRSALIMSALDADGLTLLNFINKYPTNLYLDIGLGLQGFQKLEKVVQATDFFIDKMAKFSANEAAGSTFDYASMPDLRQPGPYQTRQHRWVLNDQNRDRQFYVIVVQPEPLPQENNPVILISHGLGSRPEDFVDKAQQLASYGFVVALPQHPGSDSEQVQKLQQGLSRSYFLDSEFIDRPKDLSYVIDELERRNQTEFSGRLNLQAVGVAGHSFGGYGVLAVAGATIDFEHLQQACDRPFAYLDTALLLECRALQLPRETYNFRDERVKVVFAGNPVNYGIFGPQGLGQIQIPTFIVGGSDDPATPTVFEQARSFPALTAPTKYLALVEGQAHVNLAQLDAGVTKMLDSIPGLKLAHPELLRGYADGMLVAFFKTHLVNDRRYQPYMQSSYAAYLSRDQPFKVFVISNKSNDVFKQALTEFRAKHGSLVE
ncbi:alpha/beta hydrolase [Pantanalinema sp. GBBB05]|uniref:alpha/beta hydrolase n=1 Tax=Pantanalinema sp. GBBB05 TaxID=2604139 RepID=UPI003D8168EA